MKHQTFELKGIDVWYTGEPRHKIGEFENGTLTILRDKPEHLHRELNAYGVNADIIDSGMVEIVIIDKVNKRLLIDAETIRSEGIARTYKDERQYFIPVWLPQPI